MAYVVTKALERRAAEEVAEETKVPANKASQEVGKSRFAGSKASCTALTTVSCIWLMPEDGCLIAIVSDWKRPPVPRLPGSNLSFQSEKNYPFE